MKQWLVAAAVLAPLTILASAARSQDALAPAFQHCIDAGRSVDERIKFCTTIIQAQGLEPDETAFAYVDLGLAYDAKGSDDQALAAFNKALTLEPDLWQGLANRAFLYLERADMDAALADYEHIEKIDPAKIVMFRPGVGMDYRTVQPGTQTDVSSAARETTQHDQAVAQLKDQLSKAFAYRCRVRASQGHALDSALADCNQALQFAPGLAPALEARGVIYFQRGDYQSARNDLDAALNADPKLPVSLYLRGVARHRLGDKTGGDADIAAARALDPKTADGFAAHGIGP